MRGVSLLLGCVVIFGCTGGKPVSPAEDKPAGVLSEVDFNGLSVVVDGKRCDLSRGEYVLAFLSTSCDSCERHIGALNALAETPGSPDVIGLMIGDEDTLKELKARTPLRFPVALVKPEFFFKCIGEVPPRFMYIADNRPIRFWDEHPPACEELKEETRTHTD